MQILENSDSIVSDDQCLELDCRIIVPKFKKEEYDTFQTETNTSVISRVMKMKSNSQEFRFKQFNQFSPQGSFNCTQKQIQCSLLNEDEYSNKLKVRLHIQPEEGKLNTKKKKKKDKASQSPASSVEHNNDSQKARKQNQNAIRMQNQLNQPNQQQTIIRSNKRQLSQTFKSYSVEASPLKITRFSQRQIYVTQLVNTYEEPLQEKLSLVQLENNDKLNKGILSRYTSKAKTLKNIVQKTQLKGILKSQSCNSEGGRRRKNASQDQQNKKSSFFKKVTFNSSKLSKNNLHNNIKDVQQQHLIII